MTAAAKQPRSKPVASCLALASENPIDPEEESLDTGPESEPLIKGWWHCIHPREDAAEIQALGRVLSSARAGADASIEDQVSVAYLLGKAVLALNEVSTPAEFGRHDLMWQATVPVALLTEAIAVMLDDWADICEERWDMYRRIEADPMSGPADPVIGLAGRYPADLLSGRRLATEEEARRLAGEDATHLRAMAAAHRRCFGAARDRLHFGHIRPPDEPLKIPTALYFWYDANGVLLYIGITGDLATRQASHAKRSSWSEFAHHCTVDHLSSRQEAEAAEKAAIEAHKPLFNHTHNDTPEARARLVAYLIEHGRMDLLAPAVSRG